MKQLGTLALLLPVALFPFAACGGSSSDNLSPGPSASAPIPMAPGTPTSLPDGSSSASATATSTGAPTPPEAGVDAGPAAPVTPVNIGVSGGADQFPFLDTFLKASSVVLPPTRICHIYTAWDVALQAPGTGDLQKGASRAYLEDWFAKAEGHCDEALVTFQSAAVADGGSGNRPPTQTTPPPVADYLKAFQAFQAIKWQGWTGKISYVPWNEPNNGAGSGNGLGRALTPDEAARYYLAMRRVCVLPDCKVAAGDLASNGGLVGDYQFNCPNDTVAPSALCKQASYLDKYKNYIANHANDAEFQLGAAFRPEYFSFHPWYEMNTYLAGNGHCNDEAHCTTRALIKNLGGTWSGAELWDTEIGVGQDGNPQVNDHDQGCGAAFLIRLSENLTKRVTRIYYMRLHNGNPQIFSGNTPRPAMKVLADREQSFAPSCY